MADSLSLGALELESNTYISPIDASKDKQYRCIDCNQKAILRKGKIRRAHFAHYSPTNTCSYYDKPSEAQVHKDAKLLMAKLLKERKNIQFTWPCHHCKVEEPYAFQDFPSITYRDGDEVVLEHRDKEGKWIADVAVLNGGEVRYIIEIKNTHATTTCRPEPWYEIDAKGLIEYYEDPEFNELHSEPEWIYMIPCLRQGLQRYCYGSFCYRESWVKRIPGYEKGSCCVLCKADDYEPVSDGTSGKFQKKDIQVCTSCLLKDSYEKSLRTMYMPAAATNVVVQPDISGCNGYGYCLEQSATAIDKYVKRIECPFNCKPIQCKGLNCRAMEPQYVLNIQNGLCANCPGAFNKYLEVPYARKEEAKAMGVKFDWAKKKWYVDCFAKNRADVEAKFKRIYISH
jgi:hypothetical protein